MCLTPTIVEVILTSRHPNGIPIGPRTTVVEDPGVRVIARYRSDGKPAVAVREDGGCRRIYVGEPCGPSASLFNLFAREAGAYVPHAGTGLQVDLNGDFASVHALAAGTYEFRLPRRCRAVNLKSGLEERQKDGRIVLELTAGETCWLRFDD